MYYRISSVSLKKAPATSLSLQPHRLSFPCLPSVTKQAVGKDVPEDGAQHEQGVDAEEDPEQGLLLESLLVVLQDHHPQRQANHHPSQVSDEAGVGTRREGRRIEAQPHRPAKLHAH
ncbi:hypothetical protein EYF80_018809 [Liparis tanakae]|uniref:Uncharacterized protein n=1 Tax=Liparis tanakae TaxID=230148 RepID=A0A4Z2I190_9TELE|nr:hypothetical protein EYF80_018809 [Liparis tanakae]